MGTSTTGQEARVSRVVGEPTDPEVRASGEWRRRGSEGRWNANLSGARLADSGLRVRPSSPCPNLGNGLARLLPHWLTTGPQAHQRAARN